MLILHLLLGLRRGSSGFSNARWLVHTFLLDLLHGKKILGYVSIDGSKSRPVCVGYGLRPVLVLFLLAAALLAGEGWAGALGVHCNQRETKI